MAREKKTVKLQRPFEGGNGPVTEVVVQEPSSMEYFALGDPQTWVRTKGGTALVDNDEAIAKYVERLIVEPDPVLAMRNMSVIDAIAVKAAVLGFFQAPTESK